MPDSDTDRHPQRIAFLATEGFSEAELHKSIRAFEAAGLQMDVIGAAAPVGRAEGGAMVPRVAAERISPADYCALVIPGTPEQFATRASTRLAGLVRSVQAAGKPILYVRLLPGDGPEYGSAAPAFSLKRLGADSWERWNAIDAPRLGAALAYYTLLSLAPLLVLVASIAGVFFRRTLIQSGLIWQVRSLMGSAGAGIVRSVLENTKSATGIIAGILGMLTLLLGASGVFLELRNSLDTVWGVRPSYGTGLWSLVRERLYAFVLVLGTGLVLSLSILLSAALATPVRFLLRFVPTSGILAGLLSAGVSLVAMTLVFALIYKVVPDIRISWSDVWIGAAVTSILFTTGKWLIGLYLAMAGIGSPYAAAGSLIVFLTWVYYSVQIFLFGAEFTHAYALRHGSYSAGALGASRIGRLGRANEKCGPAGHTGVSEPRRVVPNLTDTGRSSL